MTTSKTIAGLIPTLVVIATGMLVNLGSLPAMAEQVSRDPALIFFLRAPCCSLPALPWCGFIIGGPAAGRCS